MDTKPPIPSTAFDLMRRGADIAMAGVTSDDWANPEMRREVDDWFRQACADELDAMKKTVVMLSDSEIALMMNELVSTARRYGTQEQLRAHLTIVVLEWLRHAKFR